MRPRTIPRSARITVSWAMLLTPFFFFSPLPGAWSAFPRLPSSPSQAPNPAMRDNDLAYDKPIIFFEADAQILVFYPNGDVIYRGRKLANDKAVVQALQEMLSLSPYRRAGGVTEVVAVFSTAWKSKYLLTIINPPGAPPEVL